MANMTHCRFQNTLNDLLDCERAMADGEADELSKDESLAKKRLVRACIEIAMNYGPDAVSNALFGLTSDQRKVH